MASELTPDQVRDEVARLIGWTFDGSYWNHPTHGMRWEGCRYGDHPCPASLDAAAALWAEHLPGWDWWKVNVEWLAQSAGSPFVRVPDSGSEVNDRYRLLLECLRHQQTGVKTH